MNLTRIGKLVPAVLALFIFSNSISCTPKQIASDITSQIFKGGAPSFEMEADVEIAESSALTMLKMMEAFQYDNPSNKNYLELLSRSYGNYAFGFLEWNMLKYQGVDEAKYQQNVERAKAFYEKGKQFGLKSLTKNGAVEKAMNKDLDTFKRALKGVGRGGLPALFWTAFNWGNSINLNKDSPMAIAVFPKVEAMMARVLQIDEYYFYGTPHIFFGVSYGSRPAMFGGDPVKSKTHFEKALKAYNRKFLMALVMYAQTYAVQTQDRTLFEQLLNEVLTTNAAVLPEQRLANELAKLRAAWLLKRADEYFAQAEPTAGSH